MNYQNSLTANYIVIFIAIIYSLLYNNYDYIYWLIDISKSNSFNLFLVILNVFGLYLILEKIKFNFSFSISYN
jgi:hypothetical protein